MKTLVVLTLLLGSVAAHADDPDYCKRHWDADRGCLRRHPRPWRPVFTFAGELGASHFDESGAGRFDHGFGNATTAGGVWGASIGIDFFS